MIRTIYLDMDGVLCDFDRRYKEVFGVHPDETPKKDWSKNWNDFIEGRHFESLSWMSQGEELYDGVMLLAYEASENGPMIAVEILSSSANVETHEAVSWQKHVWLENNWINIAVNIVPGKKHKKEFANKETLLIDDMQSNVDQFIANGGHAILYKNNARETLAQLYHLIEMNNSRK